MAVIETELRGIKEVFKQYTQATDQRLKDLESCKADKDDVKEISDKIDDFKKSATKLQITVTGYIIATLVGIVGFTLGKLFGWL